MEQLIADTRPDIAHLHNIYHQISPSILIPLRKYKIPVVMTLHDFKLVCPDYTFLREGKTCEECRGKYFYKAIKYKCVKNSYLKSAISALEMYLHKMLKIYEENVDCFMVLSRFSKSRFIQYGIPSEKMVFLPAPVDTEKFKPKRVSNKNDYILFFGRLSERNGITTLVGAMKHIPEIKLKIAGAGEMKGFLENHISQEKIQNVSLLGFLSKEDLQRQISGSYFTVFPNHCYHLCPSSILESFAFAKPVIAARLGSVPELVEDGKTGLLFEPRDEKQLAEKIKYLYENPEAVKKMGKNARNKVEQNYSAEKYYPKLLGLYQSLITRKNSENSPYKSETGKPIEEVVNV
jgi:glycosyltransferase involved in cell wall biosynthesis